jgi:hypothetical protein
MERKSWYCYCRNSVILTLEDVEITSQDIEVGCKLKRTVALDITISELKQKEGLAEK